MWPFTVVMGCVRTPGVHSVAVFVYVHRQKWPSKGVPGSVRTPGMHSVADFVYVHRWPEGRPSAASIGSIHRRHPSAAGSGPRD